MDREHRLFEQMDAPPPAQPQTPLQSKICATLERRGQGEMALGYLRYEALRKLSPAKYQELCRRNIAGENFDAMIDQLIMMNCQLCGEFRGHGHDCGWKEWKGATSNWPSEMDAETIVNVKFKAGNGGGGKAKSFRWSKTGSDMDILYYKVNNSPDNDSFVPEIVTSRLE